MKRKSLLAAGALALTLLLAGCSAGKVGGEAKTPPVDNPPANAQTKDDAAKTDPPANAQTKDDAAKTDPSANAQTGDKASDASAPETVSGKHHVEIEVQGYGTIAVELDADIAPLTVTNFLNLAESGFYDGLTFHRIMSEFMIQGGDPEGTGMGGAEQTIPGEFAQNGWDKNNLSHTRGVISMARAQDPDSASSQFFIVHEDSTFLDGQYAAFGSVTSGMEFVDKICEDVQPIDSNGTVPAENQPVITAVRVVD